MYWTIGLGLPVTTLAVGAILLHDAVNVTTLWSGNLSRNDARCCELKAALREQLVTPKVEIGAVLLMSRPDLSHKGL